MAQHSTELASGPIESSVVDSGTTPSIGTRRAVGLKPTMPQTAAGMRTGEVAECKRICRDV